MKKLDYNHLTTGALTVDASHLIGVVNDLIDLVNSQQEAIEKLESKVWTADFIEKYRPALENLARADDKPKYEYGNSITKVKLDGTVLTVPDTHRTVTLRIPKGMTVGEAMMMAYAKSYKADNWVAFFMQSDTDLQKALDEVEPNE